MRKSMDKQKGESINAMQANKMRAENYIAYISNNRDPESHISVVCQSKLTSGALKQTQ